MLVSSYRRVALCVTLLALAASASSVPTATAATSSMEGAEWSEGGRAVMRLADSKPVEITPTDPLWGEQWGAALIKAPTAWGITKGAPSITVAVLDTGVDQTQPDLQGAFVPGYDFVNDDNDPSDDQGHGTAVAGIVAARADNGVGGAGLCPRCSVMPVKVAAADGTATGADVASGIIWAVDRGARVVNVSLGGTFSSTVADAVGYAKSKGVLVVAAAGNNGNSDAFYPAANPGVLSVAGTQANDQLYSWSNYGSWVAVAAPGCDLTTHRGSAFAEICGTSASAPVVSGLAALAMSYSPTAAADAIKQAITSSAHRVGGVTHGRVDFAGALTALGATFAPAPAPGATPSGPSVPATSLPASSARARSATRAHLVVVAARTKIRPGSRVPRRRGFVPVVIRGGWR